MCGVRAGYSLRLYHSQIYCCGKRTCGRQVWESKSVGLR